MERIIESCFPAREVSELVKREIRNPRAYQYIHPWPGRLPGILFRALILASLLKEDDLDLYWRLLKTHEKLNVSRGRVFLDPFVGSGTSLVEALSLGMKVIGVDVNSVAWLISRGTLVPADPDEIRIAAERVSDNVRSLAEKLYVTSVNGRKVTAKAFFWVRTIRCENCGSKIRLFKTYKLAKAGKKVWVYCPHCRLIFLTNDVEEPACSHCGGTLKPISWSRFYKCPECGHLGVVTDSIREFGGAGMELFAVLYRQGDEDKVKLADEEDLARYREAEKLLESAPKDFLNLRLRFGEETSRVLIYGYKNIRELFNARQLLMLYSLAEAVSKLDGEVRSLLALALSKTTAFSTVLTSYKYVGRKPENSFALHQYMFEKMYMEINVLEGIRGSFLSNVARLLEAKEYTQRAVGNVRITVNLGEGDAELLLLPAQRLKLPPGSVDLVVTDPPHFGNVVNSGIADLHYALLKHILEEDFAQFRRSASCRDADELVFDPKRGKGIEAYQVNLARAFSNVAKALKPGNFFVVIFRHRSEEAWSIIRSSLEDAGLEFVREWSLDLENYPQPQARYGWKVKSAALVYQKP